MRNVDYFLVGKICSSKLGQLKNWILGQPIFFLKPAQQICSSNILLKSQYIYP